MGTQLASGAAAETEVALAAAAPVGYGLGSTLVPASGVALHLAGIAFVDRVVSAALILAPLGAPLSPPAFGALVTARPDGP